MTVTNTDEMAELVYELMEHVQNANGEFDERAVEIVNEVADWAENTKLYNETLDIETRAELEELSLKEIWYHMLYKIVDAPTRVHMLSAPILLMPIIREKLRGEEGRGE